MLLQVMTMVTTCVSKKKYYWGFLKSLPNMVANSVCQCATTHYLRVYPPRNSINTADYLTAVLSGVIIATVLIVIKKSISWVAPIKTVKNQWLKQPPQNQKFIPVMDVNSTFAPNKEAPTQTLTLPYAA